MDVWKFEIYFDCWPGYRSQVSKANKWDILFNTRNNFIFLHIHVFRLLYKTIVLLAHKNRAVYCNAPYTLKATNLIGRLFNRYLALIRDFMHADIRTNFKMSRPRMFELRLSNRSYTNINSRLHFNTVLALIVSWTTDLLESFGLLRFIVYLYDDSLELFNVIFCISCCHSNRDIILIVTIRPV